jgi:hypothetical protein
MMELAFGIAAFAACGPDPGTGFDVCWPQRDDDPAPVPLLLRRRVGPIGQAALRAAWAMPHIDRARFVFASRHGEFDRTLTMLENVADNDGPSPADFSLGVHNALAGLLSVATKNRRGHTAIAAGVDSFGFGLMEAAARVLEQPNEPVLLAYYDAGLPPGYPDTVPAITEATLALALTIVPRDQAPRRIVMAATPAATKQPGEAAAAVFLRFLRATAPDAAATGERMHWRWRHV